jgi:hypothetical protein
MLCGALDFRTDPSGARGLRHGRDEQGKLEEQGGATDRQEVRLGRIRKRARSLEETRRGTGAEGGQRDDEQGKRNAK